MGVFLILEASQPGGTMYRVGVGCFAHPKLFAVWLWQRRPEICATFSDTGREHSACLRLVPFN